MFAFQVASIAPLWPKKNQVAMPRPAQHRTCMATGGAIVCVHRRQSHTRQAGPHHQARKLTTQEPVLHRLNGPHQQPRRCGRARRQPFQSAGRLGREAGGADMDLQTKARTCQLITQLIDHHHRSRRHREQGTRSDERNHLGVSRGLPSVGQLDAPSLPFCHLQDAIPLQGRQGSAHGAATDLQALAQLPLARQIALPMAGLHGLAQALRRHLRQGNTLWQLGP